MLVATPGLLGGEGARRSRALVDDDGDVTDVSAAVGLVTLEGTRRRVQLQAAGGAGYESPGADEALEPEARDRDGEPDDRPEQ
jgi:hypothetical protein